MTTKLPDLLWRSSGSGNPTVGHLSEDCAALNKSRNIRKVPTEYLKRAPNCRICRKCDDGREFNGGGEGQ